MVKFFAKKKEFPRSLIMVLFFSERMRAREREREREREGERERDVLSVLVKAIIFMALKSLYCPPITIKSKSHSD